MTESEKTYTLDDDLFEIELSVMPLLLRNLVHSILLDTNKGLAQFGNFVASLEASAPERRWALIEATNILSQTVMANTSGVNASEQKSIKASISTRQELSSDNKAGMTDGLSLLFSAQKIGEPLPDAWLWYASDDCPIERLMGFLYIMVATSASLFTNSVKSEGTSPAKIWESLPWGK